MTSFQDIFKNSFLELGEMLQASLLDIVIALTVSFAVAMFIFMVYRKCYRGVLYSYNFNITIMLMTMVTAMIIVTVSSNIVLSLGMVGALSIVRYRTAVKDPMDLIYLFWAVASGIAIGARLYAVVAVGTLLIGAAIFILTRFKSRKPVYLLVINYKEEAYPEILGIINKTKYTVRSKLVRKDSAELTVELSLRDENTVIVDMLSKIEAVRDVSLVSYNGDFAQ